MYPLFVLLMMISLLLPAVPVSGCECGQYQSSASNKSCCCSTTTAKQSQKQKSCCCQSSRKNSQDSPARHQAQYQKQSCHCQQMFSQPAIIASVKSMELTEQLRSRLDSIDLKSEISVSDPPVPALAYEPSHSARSFSAGEYCAHYCLWLI